MKSIAEILKSKGITEATRFHNYEYLYKMMKDCCEKYAGQFHKPDVSGQVCRCLEPIELVDIWDNRRCGWCEKIIR